MTDDMGFDLKLPAVGELTLPQWQDWLVRYNAVLAERDNRIEKLESALRKYADEEYNGYNADGAHARKALETQTYGGQQDDSALKADHPIALSAEDIRKMNHE
jgi:hypothetical protein